MPTQAVHRTSLLVAISAVGALTAILITFWLVPALRFKLPGGQSVALHTLLEVASITVSVLVFSASWHTIGRATTNMFGLAPIAFIGVAILDFFHLLTYQGVPVFTLPYSPDQAIALFLAARVLAALALLSIAVTPMQFALPVSARYAVLAGVMVFAVGLTAVALLHADALPVYLIPGAGLTATQVNTEYLIIALNLIAAAVFLWRLRTRQAQPVVYLLAAACVMALSEFCFTLYATTTDQFIHLAHLYKLIAYLLLYRAIFVYRIRLPFEQLRQAEALAASEHQQVSNIIATATDCIISINQAHQIIVFNQAAERVFQRQAQEMLGKPLNDLLPERFRAAHGAFISGFVLEESASRSMGKTARVIYGLRASGEEFPIEASISHATGVDDTPILTVVIRDVGVERAMRRTLEVSEERFYKAFQLSPIGKTITRVDDGFIIDVNDVGAALLGYSRDEMLGRSTLDFGSWEHPQERESFVAELKRSNRVVGLESQARHRSGTLLVVRRYAELIEVDGQPCLLTTVLDITKEKQLMAQMQAANTSLEARVAERTAELEAANRALEGYAFTVSHDLRAPLRAIDGFTAILQDEHVGSMDPEAQQLTERVRARIKHMNTLIDDLLNFSRFSAQEPRKETLDARDQVRSVIEELKGEVKNAQIVVGDLPPYEADPTLMRQVWINLISNASKYSSKAEAPEIHIGFENDAYFVKDNGAGFDMAYAGKLFKVFSRLHGEHEFKGTGVGLAIVHQIVTRHGGRIWAEGTISAGAKFSFALTPAAALH